MVKRNCLICKKDFLAKKSHINYGHAKYCSRACHHQSMRKGKKVACTICGTIIFRSLKKLRRSQSALYFCSKKCQAIWRNKTFIAEKHKNWKGGRFIYRRILKNSDSARACLLCAHKDERLLAAHHIDENHTNNDIKNLAWLCHNCHYLVHHDKLEKQKFLSLVGK